MTTKAQLRKTALALPDAVETQADGFPLYKVAGRPFAALSSDGQVVLQLDEATVADSLHRCTITQLPATNDRPAAISVPLTEIDGMELNSLVFKSWLKQAPAELASRGRSAMKGEAPAGPDALPASIGAPAMRALLLAGITTMKQVSELSERDLLALHGVGPKAVRILQEQGRSGESG